MAAPHIVQKVCVPAAHLHAALKELSLLKKEAAKIKPPPGPVLPGPVHPKPPKPAKKPPGPVLPGPVHPKKPPGPGPVLPGPVHPGPRTKLDLKPKCPPGYVHISELKRVQTQVKNLKKKIHPPKPRKK